MKKKFTILILIVTAFSQVKAQVHTDSIMTSTILQVIELTSTKTERTPVSIESELTNNPKISMLKRGAYAWEPMLNNLADSRINLTIDNMQIFKACTDNMDPITSYVEVSNLQSIEIYQPWENTTANTSFGGGINLQTKKVDPLEGQRYKVELFSNYQSNNKQQNYGVNLHTSTAKLHSYSTFSYKNAENYSAGRSKKIENSQYTKFNASTKLAYHIKPGKTLEAAIIWDRALDVGYPALPMDVSLAQAFIGSLTYKTKANGMWKDWQTKVYYNNIEHHMDDSGRELVDIRMDMPGKTQTLGLWSSLESISIGKHTLIWNFGTYYNQSIASMTMYPNNPENKPMFMYTWADIGQYNIGTSITDSWKLSAKDKLQIRLALHLNNQGVYDKQGLESLKIFYPNMPQSSTYPVANISFSYQHHTGNNLYYGASIAAGNREFSASELYGFYLFNSQQNYDYIGNPFLKKESVIQLNGFLEYSNLQWKSKLSIDHFYFKNYIIGTIEPDLLPMTIGALGAKKYNNLPYAKQHQLNWELQYKLSNTIQAQAKVSYSQAQDNNGQNLPMISPLSYSLNISYKNNQWYNNLSLQANAKQNKAAIEYGESPVASFTILNWNSTFSFTTPKYNHLVKLNLGITNILNTYYTSYSSWNHLPQMGRNVTISLLYNI